MTFIEVVQPQVRSGQVTAGGGEGEEREREGGTHLELVNEDGDGVELIAGSRRISHDEQPGIYRAPLKDGCCFGVFVGLVGGGVGKERES